MNCGIFPTIYVRILGLGLNLGLACLWPRPWLIGLGLDTSGLVNIPGHSWRWGCKWEHLPFQR